MQRRTFLGAAAAVASLPAVADGGETAPTDVVEEYTVAEDYDYDQAKCGGVSGTLNHVEAVADMTDGPVSVTGVREADGWSGVSLEWACGAVSAGAGLSPADARELAARLRVAAAFADGEIDGEDVDAAGGEGGA